MEKSFSGFSILQTQNQRKKSFGSFEVTPFLLSVFGTAILLSYFRVSIFQGENIVPTVITSILVSVLLALLLKKEKLFLYGMLVSVVAIIGFAIVFRQYILAGSYDFINRIVFYINRATGLTFAYYDTSFCSNMHMATILYAIFVAIILSLYFGVLIQRKHSVILSLCLIPLMAACLFLRLSIGGYMVAVVAVLIIGSFAYMQGGKANDKLYAITIAVVTVALLIAIVVYVKIGSYQTSEYVENMQSYAKGQIEKLTYGVSDTPRGKVNEAVNLSDEVRLKVTLSEPNTVYLRGYVGSVWDSKNSSWNELDTDSYSGKFEGMIKSYEKEKFHPLSQLSNYIEGIEDAKKYNSSLSSLNISHDNIDISVENESAFRKYTYIPYGMTFQGIEKFGDSFQDVYIAGNRDGVKNDYYKGTIKYISNNTLLTYNKNTFLDEGKDFSETIGKYRVSEQDYRNFVGKFYLEIDNSEKEKYKNEIDKDNIKDLTSVTTSIREYVKDKGKVNNWSTFLYTSEAVKCYRSLDIPARYVEGYIAVADENKTPLVNGNYDIAVKSSDAHSWVEIYRYGLGWIPVEVTPGYYTDINNTKPLPLAVSDSTKSQPTQPPTMSQKNNSSSKTFSPIIILYVGIIVFALLALFIIALLVRYIFIAKELRAKLKSDSIFAKIEFAICLLNRLNLFCHDEKAEYGENVESVLKLYRFHPHPETRITSEMIEDLYQYTKKSMLDFEAENRFTKRIYAKYIFGVFWPK